VWLPLATPVLALAAAASVLLVYRYTTVDRERHRIKTAFRRYLAPELVGVVAAQPERLQLGGEMRQMTVMFCDLRGFTAISEQLKSNPHKLTQLINRFLTPMTEVIMARRGTIDKYIGDCVMAFWNAPLDDADHAANAAASALAMIAALERLNEEMAAEAAAVEDVGAERLFQPLKIGIGINSGECVVGNMGSDQRFDYSVLGDVVNLASRLEGQSTVYGVDVLIGEATATALDGWATLELDLLAFKGRAQVARIYGLLGDAGLAATPRFHALAERHTAMLELYRARDWPAALAALSECRGLSDGLAPLYDLYEARIAEAIDNPPQAGWTGVFIAGAK
jgi:adenylate cyclase